MRLAVLALLFGALLATGLVATSSSTPAQAARWYTSAPAAAKAYPTLKYRSRGAAVAYVQKRLLLTPTGLYNLTTVRKVKAWERRIGLAPDGRITRGNWRALRVPYQRVAAKSVSSSEAAKRAAIIRWAKAQTGDRYVYGGDGPDVFDCSGYTQFVYRHAIGRSLPRSPTGQMRATRRITKAQAKPGDLVFVRSGSGSRHAAIYAGGNYWYEAALPARPVGKAKMWTTDVVYGTIF